MLADLSLCFVECGRGQEGFGYRFAGDFVGKAELRIVARIVGLGAVASGFSSAAGDGTNRAWAQAKNRARRALELAESLSIFQSKDDPEIGFRFQYKVILKSDEEAAERPISFLGVWF